MSQCDSINPGLETSLFFDTILLVSILYHLKPFNSSAKCRNITQRYDTAYHTPVCPSYNDAVSDSELMRSCSTPAEPRPCLGGRSLRDRPTHQQWVGKAAQDKDELT